MEENLVVRVENLSKKFTRNIKHTLIYGTIDVLKSMIGFKPNTAKLRRGEFWALKNINFDLKKGEVLGIIGENGSGKSTLLRLLTGIFPPDIGTVTIRGRIGALIAVGAGFNPHMSGYENIYLNGTILGATTSEIHDKIEEIVNFADIGEFIHAPVSTYSSGMRVRLGFSCAIHFTPEILLIDEVLSVGDLNFRQKCFRKIDEIRKDTSIIFISHNMNQVQRLCDRVIVMDHGEIIFDGETSKGVSHYLEINNQTSQQNSDSFLIVNETTESISKLNLELIDESGVAKASLNYLETLKILTSFESNVEMEEVLIAFVLYSSDGVAITKFGPEGATKIIKGINKFSIEVTQPFFLPGNYYIGFKWREKNNSVIADATTKSFRITQPKDYTVSVGLIDSKSVLTKH